MNTQMVIPLRILEDITNGFSLNSRIGRGGYGDVYKGVYNGREIAVKLLYFDPDRGLDDKMFENEVGILLKVDKHPNIVQLVGYCYEIKKILVDIKGENRLRQHISRVICFEYLDGGSLHMCLRDESFAPNWSTRYNIIKGICEGLNFLHKCVPEIWHLDLKPANILLDNYMVPKLADLGLSRLFTQSQTHVTEKIIGTLRYMPPEFIDGGNMSAKNDVFSLGVVMIDIMTGHADYSNSCETGDVTQFNHEVLTNWSTMNETRWMYRPREIDQMKTCIELANRCVDFKRENRPTVEDILKTLNETETDIPKIQLADVLPCPTIGSQGRMSDPFRAMIDEAANIRNQHRHSSSMPGNISIVQQFTDIQDAPTEVEDLIIGRAEEIQDIVDTLFGSITTEITILPIYGIGGIGKTTLAWLVFNDSRFTGYSRVWIKVSQNLDLDRICKKLGELLTSKKILIVLDDVWETDPRTIKHLKAMLSLGVGSMVTTIVTTRDKAIAREICHMVEPYKLKALTDKNCWKILKHNSAFKTRADKERLKHKGKEIANKCGGLALAAQSLGYMLRNKHYDMWEKVRDSYIWKESSLDISSRSREVLASLEISYSHMDDMLKLCFSYCAVFPKGHNIVKYDLIHQWIALGFVKQYGIFDSMMLCEDYVTQLLGMSFLEHSKAPSSDQWTDKDATFFTMHDLVHDLARTILADKVNDKGSVGDNGCHYASLIDCSKPLELAVASPANIKALHFLDCGELNLCDDAFSPAKDLLVLNLSECFIQKLPASMCQLKHLRYLHAPRIQDLVIPNCITELSELNYLNLRGSRKISALPESIGNMKGLMHLDLSGCDGIRELPVSFTELKQLVHLDLSQCCMYISEAIGGFTKLQYLNLSVQHSFYPKCIRGLPQIILNLTKLRYLNLSGCTEVTAKSQDEIHNLLFSVSTLSNLEHLDFSENKLLSIIPESIGNLRMLHTLDLSGCNNLKKLPDSIVNMISLKVLKVHNLDESMPCQLNFASLPHFVVHASSDKSRSNIILLQPTNPDKLTIDRLENVKSVKEAQCIKLSEKQKIEELAFQWTTAAESFVDDKEVLEKLVPPSSVRVLLIDGYRGVSFPDWLMDIRQYLPNLTHLHLSDLPNCINLPPLGQLPNLHELGIYCLDSLEEWNTASTSSEDGFSELMFPMLAVLRIARCAKLTIKPCLPRAMVFDIQDCDNVLLSRGESSLHIGGYSSSPTLQVTDCKVPMYEWRLLHQLPALDALSIYRCSDLTASPEIIQQLSSLESFSLKLGHGDTIGLPRWLVQLKSLRSLMIFAETNTTTEDPRLQELPQWLGELTSLHYFEIRECEGIRYLPDSIQQLTELACLKISGCPTLEKWCRSKENKMKLAHITRVELSGEENTAVIETTSGCTVM